MNNIKETFGEAADLYSVLGLKNRDDAENAAKLRKAYFRKALVYHPDKTKEKNAEVAKAKFQAISFAYQVLKNPEKRAEYNDTGHVDEEHDDDNEDVNAANAGGNNWKDYFDLIFGKLTTNKIDQFALKYKCSEEEQRDVLQRYKEFKGDLNKMLEFVMLSNPVDCRRWLEDYIKPAIASGSVPDYNDMIQKSLKKVEKKIEKEQKKQQEKKKAAKTAKSKSASKKENQNPASSSEEEEEEEEEMTDEDATETESEDEEPVKATPAKSKKKAGPASSNKKRKATKAKPTKAKKKSKEDDLVAMIQANQSKRSGAAFFSDMAARYGAKMDEDPLGDDEFENIQARLKKNKRSR
ncbi:DnaJ homolog subfamily C member 9 [Seminavis robusta]|uniref:DnaJ homolog subfamily C member 9 n=1 Tax=Seminavis robusta TaxID=568900 RepID=A0A9N8EA71_9STRA|nr:DnaJ homolog subfamily C member 9 [Seminavis robusta]|eukprot:Sro851_g210910.1 DnaJ homolog subfamily C member 9 (352) ;mRNA; f:34338-35393